MPAGLFCTVSANWKSHVFFWRIEKSVLLKAEAKPELQNLKSYHKMEFIQQVQPLLQETT